MPRAWNDVEMELRIDCVTLARAMVRLEDWAHEAHERGRFVRVAELNDQREQTREYRSQLLRELWEARR
jgi:hypothetical protein